MSAYVRRLAITGWQFLRAFWMIIGISVGMFLFAESCARLQVTTRNSVGGAISQFRNRGAPVTPRPPHPAETQPWYPQYLTEFVATANQGWRPWVYFRRAEASSGQLVNVDSQLHRVTPQPRTPAQPVGRVYFFGGSTMWGSDQRDEHTIAAEASRRLQSVAGPNARYEVVNFGESGHVNTQGMLELMLQLRAGNRPNVVVFFDGINDTFSVLQNGQAGVGQNEMNRISEFTTGRKLTWGGHREGLEKDLHSYWMLATMSFERTHLGRNLLKRMRPSRPTVLLTVDSAARSVARVYSENARMIESLGRTYGFTPIFVWQPTLHATEKTLTPYEERLMRGIRRDSLQNRLRNVHFAILPILDSTMATIAPGRFVNEGRLFKGDTIPVFTDQVGHNTEASIPAIVDGFWPALQSAVSARAGSSGAILTMAPRPAPSTTSGGQPSGLNPRVTADP